MGIRDWFRRKTPTPSPPPSKAPPELTPKDTPAVEAIKEAIERKSTGGTSRGGGGGSQGVSSSENLMTTREGVVDVRTGKVVSAAVSVRAPTRTELASTSRASRIAEVRETVRERLNKLKETAQEKLRNLTKREDKLTIYNPATGTYQTTAEGVPDVSRSTVIMTPPTTEQKAQIDIADYKGELAGKAIFSVPSQYLPNPFLSLTKEEKEKLTGLKGLNPKTQFEVFKDRFDYERDLGKAEGTATRLENLNKEFEEKEKKLTEDIKKIGEGKIQDGSWTGSEEDLTKYNKLIETYNKETKDYSSTFEAVAENKAYQNVIKAPERTNLYQDISTSTLSPSKKILLTGGIAATEFATFFNPIVRVVRGGEILTTGLTQYRDASTKQQERQGLLNIGVGSLVAGSGLKFGGGTTSTITKVVPKTLTSTAINVAKVGGVITVKAGVSGLYGREVFMQTGNLGMGIAAGVGGFSAIASPEIYKASKAGFSQYKKTFENLYKDKRAKAGGSKQTTKQVQVQKPKPTKEEIKKYLDDLADEHLSTKGTGDKVDLIRKDLDKLIKTGNKEAVNRYFEFLKGTYGEDKAKLLLTEYFAQEGVSVGAIDVSKPTTGITDLRGGQIGTVKGGQITTTDKPIVGFSFDNLGKTIEVTKTKTETKTGLDTLSASASASGLLSGSASTSLSSSAEKTQTKQQQQQKQIPSLQQSQPQKQEQISKQRLLTKQPQSLKQVERFKSKPKKTITPPPPFSFGSPVMKQVKRLVQDKDNFGVFVTKFGKDIKIGEYETIGQAKKKLTGTISSTLRASGYITKNEKKIKAKELNVFGSEFRPSKESEFKVVERKTRRLKKGTSENIEIIGFRKGSSKSKKKKLSSIF